MLPSVTAPEPASRSASDGNARKGVFCYHESNLFLSSECMEKVIITAEDGMRIHGLYREAEGPKGVVLLLHMMPATKESWDVFADALRQKGYSSLAIDERGHGESDMKGGERLDYREMSDEEQQAKRLDVEASADWLMERTGLDRTRLAAVGASIGANLAIRYAFDHPECRVAVALSPGLDYRGVLTEDAVGGLKEGQALLIAVSDEDATSAMSVKALETLPTRGERETVHLRDKGHGTTMFGTEPELMDRVLEWISARL